MFQELKFKTYDQHLEIQVIELTAGGNNMKLVNTYLPPSSSCDAGYKTSINELLELEDCVIVGDFNAHSLLWQSKSPKDTRRNNTGSERDL